MALFRKNRKASHEVEIQPSSLLTKPLSLTDLDNFNRKVETTFGASLNNDPNNLEILDIAPRLSYEVPTDSFSILVYVTLNSCEVSPNLYIEFIKDLERRKVLDTRLQALNQRIARLSADIKNKEAIFADARFEVYLNSLKENGDVEEKEKESLHSDASLYSKRESFKSLFLLLAQLEMNRVHIHQELSAIFSNIKDRLPRKIAANNLKEEINSVLLELHQIKNVTTSDGEEFEDESDFEEIRLYIENRLED